MQIKPNQGQEQNPILQKGEMNTIEKLGISLRPNTPYNCLDWATQLLNV